MTTNTFDTEESNSSISSPQYYVDDDGSLKFISPVLSSSNFDGSVPVFEGQISASAISPGKFIKIGEEYFPVLSVSYDDPELEDDPSEEITATYLDSNSEVQSITYNLFDDVDVKYENWEEKYLGTQGWSLTYGGNAIFTNVAVRGRIEAEEGYISSALTIGSNGSSTIDDLVSEGQLSDNTTIISGGNILTGTVSASRIDVDNLFVKNLLTNNQTNYSRIGIQPSLYQDRINFYSGLISGPGGTEVIAPYLSTAYTYSGGAIKPSWSGVTISSGTNTVTTTEASMEFLANRTVNSPEIRAYATSYFFNSLNSTFYATNIDFSGTIIGDGSQLTGIVSGTSYNYTLSQSGPGAAANYPDGYVWYVY